jgi:hypothetical protein
MMQHLWIHSLGIIVALLYCQSRLLLSNIIGNFSAFRFQEVIHQETIPQIW